MANKKTSQTGDETVAVEDADAVSATQDKTGMDEPTEPQPEGNAADENQDVSDLDETREPAPETPPERVIETRVETRSGFLPAVVGGLIAAGLGFVSARTEVLDPILPEAWRAQSVDISPLTGQIKTQADQIAALTARLDGMPAPDLSGVEGQIADVSGNVREIAAAVEGVKNAMSETQSRIVELEKAPMTSAVSQAAIDAYERELAALQSAMATQRGEVEALLQEAEAKQAAARMTEARTQAQAAITEIVASLNSGTPFAESLNAFSVATGQSAPAELARVADTGAATLAQLQGDFPDLARAALAAARSEQKGESEGIAGFLQRQLGARSVAPREGNDPDAVLSRAEAALRSGDLAGTIAETDMLPDVAKSELDGWLAAARARLAALSAAEALLQSLNNK